MNEMDKYLVYNFLEWAQKITKSLCCLLTIKEMEVVIKNILTKKTPCQIVAEASFSKLSGKRSFQFYANFSRWSKQRTYSPLIL